MLAEPDRHVVEKNYLRRSMRMLAGGVLFTCVLFLVAVFFERGVYVEGVFLH